jgi:PAS domain S-box-containing protein
MWQWKDDETRIVPKISYVKGFAPWGWIIGTGIYIEDVKAEIALITRNVINISLAILLIMALLLASIIISNYKTEKNRHIAEVALKDSEEKYRTLVESASEGMFMVVNDKFIYSNITISKLLEYNQAEFGQLHVNEIFENDNKSPGYQSVQDLVAGRSVPERFEAQLKTKTGEVKEVILSTSEIFIGGKPGFIAVVTDITHRKKAEDELGESEEKFRTLANNLNVGIYRRTIGKKPYFVEANPAMVTLFGYEKKEDLFAIPISDLYADPRAQKGLGTKAINGKWEREILELKKKDGTVFSASIWAVTVYDEEGMPKYFDGIIEDVTDMLTKERARDKFLYEMQNAMSFLNAPVSSLPLYKVASCKKETPLQEAVVLLNESKADILLIFDENGIEAGVVTDADLRKNIFRDNFSMRLPVSEIMSSTVFSIVSDAYIFEAVILMQQKSITHLFIKDRQKTIFGVVKSEDITLIQNYAPSVLLQEIKNAESPAEIVEKKDSIPFLVTTLINSGSSAGYISHLITTITDTLLNRLIEFAIKEIGIPPVRFSFLVFGSEGREEQTLSTDQDNAIVYEDVPKELEKKTRDYFLSMSKKVCGWLNDAGYKYCDGDNMAQNPKWCQPLSVWKRYFSEWISDSSAEDLLQVKIFFDFKSAYGDDTFALELRKHLAEVTVRHPSFFQYLARNVLKVVPPIGFFGNIVVEPVETHGKALDIKSSLMPIVDYARIYALKYNVDTANTLKRLERLYELGVLTKQNYEEVVYAYSHLMQIRLRIQAEAVLKGNRGPDNYVSPGNLTYIEQKMLKEIFSQTKHFQAKLSYDFTGRMDGRAI